MKRENWNTREKRRDAERKKNQLGELLKVLIIQNINVDRSND